MRAVNGMIVTWRAVPSSPVIRYVPEASTGARRYTVSGFGDPRCW